MILIDDLNVKRNGRELLSKIACHLPQGQLTVLLGPNGAGKSTLLRCLAGLEAEGLGSVYLAGRALGRWGLEERARLLAWVPAESQMPFAFTVGELLLLGRYPWHRGYMGEKDKVRVDEILALLELTSYQERIFSSLSSGEKKWVMLARAFVQDTPLLLLDEPCAHLDLAGSLKLWQLLSQLCEQGRTICVSSHNLNLALKFGAYGLLLDKGQLQVSGELAQVLSPRWMQQVFHLRSELLMTPKGERLLLMDPIF